MPDFVDEMGTSLVLIHTERGKELFDDIKEKLDLRESNTKDGLLAAEPAGAHKTLADQAQVLERLS